MELAALRTRSLTQAVSLMLAAIAMAPLVGAEPGSLDPSFSGDGLTVLSVEDGAYQAGSIVIDGEGRLVVAMNYGEGAALGLAVVRFLPDGTLDPNFGSGGIATDDLVAPEAFALELRADDSLLIAGRRLSSFFVSVRESSGALRTAFGNNGRAAVRFSNFSQDVARAVGVQSSGRIVLAGQSDASISTNLDFAQAAFDAGGDLATGFGTSGKTLTDFDGGADAAFDLAVQDDDTLVVAGRAAPSRSGPLYELRAGPLYARRRARHGLRHQRTGAD